MAPHSSTLACKISWMEEPGRLQSMGLLRVGHDWVTSLSLSLSCIGEGNGNPLQCSCLENPRDSGAWWAAVSGVAQSRTRLKWLSSSSSSIEHLKSAIQFVKWFIYFISFNYFNNFTSSYEAPRVSRGRERLRNIFKTLKLDLELGNVELKFKLDTVIPEFLSLIFMLKVSMGLELDRQGFKHWPCIVKAEWHWIWHLNFVKLHSSFVK